MSLADGSSSDWWLGLSIGFAIVVVVVIVVAVILSYASRIGDQAGRALGGLEEVRDGTAPLWEVRKTNNAAVAILEAARSARGAVVAKLTGAAPAPAEPSATAAKADPQEPGAAGRPSPLPATGAKPTGVRGPSYPSGGRRLP